MMKPFITSILLFTLMHFHAQSQRVGIGTTSPNKLLTVNGSIMLDQGNMNSGSVDSAALRFGTSSLVGISSNRNAAFPNLHGMDFWTNGINRLSVTSIGRVGINTTVPAYTLDVNGTARVGYLYTAGVNSTASIFTDFDLNADDDLYVGDDATMMGNVGIGGNSNSSYTLRVEGNGLFTTNVGIDGTLRVDDKITNGGKGIMKSNSSTTLRSGFTSGTFSYNLVAGSAVEIDFCITPFVGDDDNVRVMVAQFVPGTGASAAAGNVTINVVRTQATGGGCGGNNSTATVRFSNSTNTSLNLGSNAKLYLYTVVTD